MTDAGTLATTAQVLLAIGANASAVQISETNTNIWILQAESDIAIEAGIDLVAEYTSIGSGYKQFLASVAANRAAFYGINQDQNTWQLATTQSKLNVINDIWQSGKKWLNDPDKITQLGLKVIL